jgi:hypothetical protein
VADPPSESANRHNPDAWYLARRTFAFVWPYDESGKMLGEHVYEDSESKIVTEVDPQDAITGQRAAGLLIPIIDKYELPA